jgi:hypothetical protein
MSEGISLPIKPDPAPSASLPAAAAAAAAAVEVEVEVGARGSLRGRKPVLVTSSACVSREGARALN